MVDKVQKMQNTLFKTDMPDPDIVRVGDTFYMVSTTMFLMPGAPILCSKDLLHWKLLSYIFTTIEDHENYRLEQGKHAYGKGQWATSLTCHKGRFYACFVCHDMGKTFIYSTDNPAKTDWDRVVIDEVFHDMSFLFWEDRVFLVYDNGEIKIVELEQDLSGVKENGLRKLLFSAPTEEIMLRCEGCRAIVRDGWIYLLFIEWPKGGIRRQVCYRSKSLEGPYERKVILEETCGRDGCGIAQGTFIDDAAGNWYGVLFQDRGASGRIPYLFRVTWEEGWPVIETEPISTEEEKQLANPLKNKKSEEKPEEKPDETGLFADAFLTEEGQLHKAWQWNHNPLEGCFEVNRETGCLRLTTGQLATGLLDARNTLTQRTREPGCSFRVKLDYSGLKAGDYAGICAFQGKYGQLGVHRTETTTEILLKQKQESSFGVGKIVPDRESRFLEWKENLSGNAGKKQPLADCEDFPISIYLRIDYDFGPESDLATFYYSFDNRDWVQLGEPLKMVFTLDMFIGYRTGLFCYATREIGGYGEFYPV